MYNPIHKKAFELISNQAISLQLKTKNDDILYTNIFWFFKDESKEIRLMYEIMEKEGSYKIYEETTNVKKYLDYAINFNIKIFDDGPNTSSNLIKAMVFYHDHGLVEIYDTLCNSIKKTQNNIIIMKMSFGIVQYNLKKNELYDQSIKLMKHNMDSSSYKNVINFVNDYYPTDIQGIVYRDVCTKHIL